MSRQLWNCQCSCCSNTEELYVEFDQDNRAIDEDKAPIVCSVCGNGIYLKKYSTFTVGNPMKGWHHKGKVALKSARKEVKEYRDLGEIELD